MGKELPKRKPTRLKDFDYSTSGAYFVTICVQNRERILSEIIMSVGDGALDVPQNEDVSTAHPCVISVGDGSLDVPQNEDISTVHPCVISVGDGALDVPQIRLTPIGKIVEKFLLSSENISGVKIDQYIIMPDHIHAIIILDSEAYVKQEDGTSRAPFNGTSRAPSPTNEMLPHVISTFKRFCNREIGDNIFQRGYNEHIIRDWEDYETRRKYIYENPMRWQFDRMYTEE